MRPIIKNIVIVITVLVIGMNYSCAKSQEAEDREIIEQYISDHNIAAVELDNTGLFYAIADKGGSLHPSSSATVTVNYTGELVDGTVFDSNDNVKLSLQNTIVGWKLGIPLIGESGKIKLMIPSGMGYGTKAAGSIPENSVLIFDVDLLLFN